MSYSHPTPAWIPEPQGRGASPSNLPRPCDLLSPLAANLLGGAIPGNLPAVSSEFHTQLMTFRAAWDRIWRGMVA